MTHDNYIRNLLNIKDENIHFYENGVNFVELKKGIKTQVIKAYLTYSPEFCPKCGCINENNSIIKWDYKKNCKIKISKICNYNAIILLDKQRFMCKHCNKTFTASTSLVKSNKQISNNLELFVKQQLVHKISLKEIAFSSNISSSSVNRILDSIYTDNEVKMNGRLPERLGIDEFKATKDTKSKMAFVIYDHDKKIIFDLLDSRFSKDICSYFMKYPYYERRKVKVITMDLYKPYYKLMHKLFPNATIVPDRFHIVVQFRNILDSYRISLCKKTNPNYNKLKKYWKLILKNENDLDQTHKFYSKNFRKKTTEQEIVTYLVNTNSTLNTLYNIYQGILHALSNRNINKFWNILDHISKSLNKKLNTTLKTLNSLKKYIDNSFSSPYSNGPVEGTNNFIKSIVRISYGFRKFKHLKTRIMLCKGYYKFC